MNMDRIKSLARILAGLFIVSVFAYMDVIRRYESAIGCVYSE